MANAFDVPFRSAPMPVRPEWIDENDHLNMAYYHVLFDHGLDQFYATFGVDSRYRRDRGMTTFSAEVHVRYLKEIHEGDEVVVETRILDFDEKRLHMLQEIRHPDGWVSATAENLTLSIDRAGPKVAPWPADIRDAIAAIAAGHAALPRPDDLGRAMGIRRKA